MLTSTDSDRRDLTWYVEHFGHADAMEERADALAAEAERARNAANRARSDVRAAASMTELFNGFPLTIWSAEKRIKVHSPLNGLSARAYQSARSDHNGTWAVNIDGHGAHGGEWLGPGWTEQGAIQAAKSWVATGERPTRS